MLLLGVTNWMYITPFPTEVFIFAEWLFIFKKMSDCDTIPLGHMELSSVTWGVTEGNELYGFSLSVSSVMWQPPPRHRLGQLVGSWLPSKRERLWYASLLHGTTQSRSFSQQPLYLIWLLTVCASFRGLPVFHTYGNHSDIRKLQSFSAPLPLLIFFCQSLLVTTCRRT